MSVVYNRTFSTTCPGDLITTINNTPAIGVTLEQIIGDGSPTLQFWFASSLSAPQQTAFDTILTTFSCPVTETSAENAVLDDTQTGTTVIWSSSQITNELGNYIPHSQKGASNGVATLDSGGKIPTTQLPSISISETFVVASQVAMLTLTAQTGDVAVRTDLNKSFILRGSDPTVLGDWQELLTPSDVVTSIFGRTGVVTAVEGDYTLNLLGDVNLTSPTNGQVLRYNGTQWVNGVDYAGTVTSITASQPAAGLTITGSPITTSGTLTFALANDLAGVEGLGTTGIATRTAADTWTTRTIIGTAGNITVTNGNGVSGNPTLNLETVGVAGTYAGVTTDQYGRVTAGTASQSVSTGGTGLIATPTNGQLLIGNGTGYTLSTLTAGTNITITNSAGGITINSTGGSSATPGGSDTCVQFNDAGTFGGDTNFVYDKANDRLTINGTVATQSRLVLLSGTLTADPAQINQSAMYIQVDGDTTYEGIRTYFKRSATGISGWITYHYDQNTPNLRITDEDDDPPYISFRTVGSGTYNTPQYESSFGARGTIANRTTGFSWWQGNVSDGGTEIMSCDSNFLKVPVYTTATRPTSPSNGMMGYNSTTNKFEGYENGTWSDFVQSTGSGIFGENFQQASSDVESATTSTSWMHKINMTTASLPAGTYRIGWNAEVRSNSTSSRAQLRVQIDDTVTIANPEQEPQDTNNYMPTSGFYYYTGSGVLSIDMDYSSTSASATTYIRRARLEIWRVS